MTTAILRARLRNAARIALYGSLGLTALLCVAIYPVIQSRMRLVLGQDWQDVDFASLPEVQRLQSLIRIDTTPETGQEIEAARFLASLLESEGLECSFRLARRRWDQGDADQWRCRLVAHEDRRCIRSFDVIGYHVPGGWQGRI